MALLYMYVLVIIYLIKYILYIKIKFQEYT